VRHNINPNTNNSEFDYVYQYKDHLKVKKKTCPQKVKLLAPCTANVSNSI
jgi:hypothetical protein